MVVGMTRLHAVVAFVVAIALPAWSWSDGSGWLAWTMFSGSQTYRIGVTVMDSDGVDNFRIVDGDRLMWESPETTWAARPQRFAGAVRRAVGNEIRTLRRLSGLELLEARLAESAFEH